MNINLSRVIGPAIGGVLFAEVGAAWVFASNAFTFVFIIGALWTVQLSGPRSTAPRAGCSDCWEGSSWPAATGWWVGAS